MLPKLPPLTAAAMAMPSARVAAVSTAAAMTETNGAGAGVSYTHTHYNHTDSCRFRRWTARESYEYMYARAWDKVVEFYGDLVRRGTGASGLLRLFGNEKYCTLYAGEDHPSCSEKEAVSVPSKRRGGRWERVSFKIILSYHGSSFDGWQKQPGLNTVQGLVEKHLGQFVDEMKANKLKAKSLPIEGCAIVAGRTDKGVTALQQVCSFYTWRKDVKSREIKDAINEAVPDNIRALLVSQVSREFHPNFSAKWRRYVYVFPLDEEMDMSRVDSPCSPVVLDGDVLKSQFVLEKEQPFTSSEGIEDSTLSDTRQMPRSFDVSKVNQLLRRLEGKILSYRIFARDTQASRSTGPPTECFMFHSRAMETILSPVSQGCEESMRVMCVELVANRFLRRMVRVLVATAIREAAAGADDDALLNLLDATCRRATAPPAPAEGLCLLDVGYEEFKEENCFIVD